MIKVILGMMVGLAGHQADAIVQVWEENDVPRAWTLLARYVIGMFLVLPVYIILRRGDERSSESILDAQAFITAASTVGAGVAAGHLLDGLK